MARKYVTFDANEKDLLKAAEGKDNFSVYIKELIALDIGEETEDKPKFVEPNNAKPTIFIKNKRRSLPYLGIR